MKKILITLTTVIIITALGVGVWAIWQQNKPVEDTNQPNNTNQTDTTNTATKPLTLYYVATEDNGIAGPMIGCGDSLVSRTTAPVTTSDVVKSSFEQLLAGKEQFIGQSGLYNALYQSNLTFVSSSVADDTVTVNLSGSLKLGGECDSPRVQAQLETTAQTASGAEKAVIFLNNKPLSEALSLQ